VTTNRDDSSRTCIEPVYSSDAKRPRQERVLQQSPRYVNIAKGDGKKGTVDACVMESLTLRYRILRGDDWSMDMSHVISSTFPRSLQTKGKPGSKGDVVECSTSILMLAERCFGNNLDSHKLAPIN
jgi:hypothetical protein